MEKTEENYVGNFLSVRTFDIQLIHTGTLNMFLIHHHPDGKSDYKAEQCLTPQTHDEVKKKKIVTDVHLLLPFFN